MRCSVGEHLEVRVAGRRAVVVEDLADHRDRRQAGEPGEVDGRLGVAAPLERRRPGRARSGNT